MESNQSKKSFFQSWKFFTMVIIILVGAFVTINMSGILGNTSDAEPKKKVSSQEYLEQSSENLMVLNHEVAIFLSLANETLDYPEIVYDSDWKVNVSKTTKAIENNLSAIVSLKAPKEHKDIQKDIDSVHESYKTLVEAGRDTVENGGDDLLYNIMSGIEEGMDSSRKAYDKIDMAFSE